MDIVAIAEAPRCAACGFAPDDWTTRDLARTLEHAEDLVAGWSVGADGDVAAQGRAVLARARTAGDPSARVHALWHGLVALADARRERGDAALTQRGTVVQLNRSGGGVPKLPVPSVVVGHRGLAGDVQKVRQHHGRPWQALSLWSAERIDALATDGHPIAPGAAGENITVRGLDWAGLRAGVVVDIGSVRCQLSAPAVPCRKIRALFLDRDVGRIDHDRHPGWSRWYASVLGPGRIATGDRVEVEPTAPLGGAS